MTGIRKKLDPKTSALIKKAARSQAENGLKEIVISSTNVLRRKRELAGRRRVAEVRQYRSRRSQHQLSRLLVAREQTNQREAQTTSQN